MLLVEGQDCFLRSSAVLRVVVNLGWPWKIAGLLYVIPAVLRNWIYDRVALNRYRLFGRYQVCQLPQPDHDARFLESVLPPQRQ